jgi:hypothetical protein
MTDVFEPYSSTLITGGAIHKVTREFRPLAGEDEHPLDDWVHNPNATLVANDYWKLNVAEDELVEMTAQEKIDWDAEKVRRKSLGSVFSASALDPIMEPMLPGASKVVANDRPALEVQNGVTGWGATQTLWRQPQRSSGKLCCRVAFILKESGTGTKVRIAARAKAEKAGEDSSESFADTGFSTVTTSYTTLGEVFEACVELDASSFALGDAIALQIGRDGNNEISGTGDNDDVDVAIQIIGLQTKVL